MPASDGSASPPTARVGYLSQPVRRREDDRLLRGAGRYVDDLGMPGAAFAHFLRSPHAHARLGAVSTAMAKAMPGVLAVLTAEDWEKAGHGDLPCMWSVDFRDGRKMNEATRPALAAGKVRHVGDTVAAVIAETRYQAMDAAESITVDYQPLPGVASTGRALDDDAPVIHEPFGTNLAFDIAFGDAAATAAAFSCAALVVELDLLNNRIAPAPMEPRAVAARVDPDDGRYILWSATQNPHLVRRWLAENSLHLPEHKIRVVAPDVGGGFGQKITHYPEEPIVLWAAIKLGRPVRWLATRSDHFLTDTHGRDHVTRCAMAFDGAGGILALRADTVAAIGAYMSAFGAAIPGYFYAPLLSGLYAIPAIHARIRGVYTNTTPTDAYRGAGRPEATFVVERLVEAGARRLGIDVCELRRRNFIPADRFPYVSAVGMRYDSGNYAGLLEKLQHAARYVELRTEQRRLRAQGVLMGIGVAGFIDSAGGAPSRIAASMGARRATWDAAIIRVHPTGKVSVFCGGHSHGQGHATAFSQIVADRLGCAIDDVDVIQGDTDRVPYGHGTSGSRSLSVIGIAVVEAADKVARKAARIAAHLLECAEGDVRVEAGRYAIVGTDRSIDLKAVAGAAHHARDLPAGIDFGLEESAFYDPPGRNVPSSIHLCVVVIDPETGRVAIRDFWSIDDVGRIVNPMIVEGQVHGGLAQGIGQALLEGCVFDAEGQPLTGSFMDYAMPRADDLPNFRSMTQETPSPDNPLGVKGAGESGTIGGPAAVANAVHDALAPLGIGPIDMPFTPQRVWCALRAARRG